jgi:hypothetical protein
MWKQPFENKKELRESYLKMPPEALLIRKMGPNIALSDEAQTVARKDQRSGCQPRGSARP